MDAVGTIPTWKMNANRHERIAALHSSTLTDRRFDFELREDWRFAATPLTVWIASDLRISAVALMENSVER